MRTLVIRSDATDSFPLADGCVQTVVTSPPYWGLRDYGVDGQLGLEKTPEEYVEKMVGVFREVWRVLRDDGTVWLNMGDCYISQGGPGNQGHTSQRLGRRNVETQKPATRVPPASYKPKDMVGMPWRLAFALQADGWYLRSDIVWSKPNPMPESVTDRPTKAHEYVFLLTKSARYYYDADAVRTPDINAGRVVVYNGTQKNTGHENGRYPGADGKSRLVTDGRNLRSVWTIATQAFPEAHFATFPTALVRPCILAGTSECGCCPNCGIPWRRITETTYVKSPVHGSGSVIGRHESSGANGWDGAGLPRLNKDVRTMSWEPGCVHSRDPVPCLVLDPFAGSGTVGVVARQHGRRFVGLELSPTYATMAQRRIQQEGRPKESRPLRDPSAHQTGLFE